MTTTKEQDRNLRDAAKELFGYRSCMHCMHFIRDIFSEHNGCKAFPEKISDEIFWGRNLHKEPYHGDHGVLFESPD
jgi:hypothetical protein